MTMMCEIHHSWLEGLSWSILLRCGYARHIFHCVPDFSSCQHMAHLALSWSAAPQHTNERLTTKESLRKTALSLSVTCLKTSLQHSNLIESCACMVELTSLFMSCLKHVGLNATRLKFIAISIFEEASTWRYATTQRSPKVRRVQSESVGDATDINGWRAWNMKSAAKTSTEWKVRTF